MKVVSIIGGRQHLMKVYALHHELVSTSFDHSIIDIGVFNQPFAKSSYKELKLPDPIKIFPHFTEQEYLSDIKEISFFLTAAFLEIKPDLVLIYGDIAPSVAACYASKSSKISIAHVESGLRNGDLHDTEELNRLLIDHFSDILFVTDSSARDNLISESINPETIFLVGNSIVYSLEKHLKNKNNKILKEKNIVENNYLLITFHREENISSEVILCELINAIEELSTVIEIVFIQYPDTQKAFAKFGLQQHLNNVKNLLVLNTLSYEQYLGVLSSCKFVITDSSGIQDEATYLGKPCIICREKTHRKGALLSPNSYLVGTDSKNIIAKSKLLLKMKSYIKKYPNEWNLAFGKKIASVLARSFRMK